MNSTNDNLPMNRHSIKADVMGVRWLRAVASFILLKTKKGRDFFYITFVTFNSPKIAASPIIPITTFLVVNKLVGSLFLFSKTAYESALKKLIGIYTCVCAPCIGNLLISTFNCCSPPSLSLKIVPSTTSPLFFEYVLTPTIPPTDICVENGFVKKYLVICFYIKFTYKYTKILLVRWLLFLKILLTDVHTKRHTRLHITDTAMCSADKLAQNLIRSRNLWI